MRWRSASGYTVTVIEVQDTDKPGHYRVTGPEGFTRRVTRLSDVRELVPDFSTLREVAA